MANKPKYSEDNIQALEFQDHIRKRPGMYIGQVNHKGYVETLKKIITQVIKVSGCNTVRLLFRDEADGEIEFDNIRREIYQDISTYDKESKSNMIELPTLNGLSKNMEVTFDSNERTKQVFIKGKANGEISSSLIKCQSFKVDYTLDKEIWGNEFAWNSNYLSYELREYCYLNPKVQFEITEQKKDFSNTNIYQFKNGLSDRLEIEILNGIGVCYFKHHFLFKTDKFELDAAFAFRQYSVDQTFIKTYVNNEITPEDGSHIDGLLKGLTYGVMKHFQTEELVNDYKISEKGMKQGLVCLINIKMDDAIFSGCVKNKLANSEIIEPIASYVSELLYDSILKDKESTEKLIYKFKIGKV
jgi:DNA gyrase/topoisomerase IV subunit B